MYIMLNKPDGVVCATRDGLSSTVLELLPQEFRRKGLFPAGRLDKDTEGVVLVAKSGVVHSLLQSLGGELKKIYLARAEGVISAPFTVDAPIARGEDVTRVVSVQGQRAITRFAPLKTDVASTLVAALPVTGRTHQIRLHLAHAGHAAVGDTLYGKGVGAYDSGQRLACYLLCFPHPVTGEKVQIVANAPSFLGEECALPSAKKLLSLFW
jgi:pseudouridine synthase